MGRLDPALEELRIPDDELDLHRTQSFSKWRGDPHPQTENFPENGSRRRLGHQKPRAVS